MKHTTVIPRTQHLRSVAFLDVENLCDTTRPDDLIVSRMTDVILHTYPWKVGDLWYVGSHRRNQLAAQIGVRVFRDATFLNGLHSTADTTEQISRMIDDLITDGHRDHTIIASGDNYFVDDVRKLQAHGIPVTIMSQGQQLSWQLALTADDVIMLNGYRDIPLTAPESTLRDSA